MQKKIVDVTYGWSLVGLSVSRYILGAHKTVTPKAENVINLIAL